MRTILVAITGLAVVRLVGLPQIRFGIGGFGLLRCSRRLRLIDIVAGVTLVVLADLVVVVLGAIVIAVFVAVFIALFIAIVVRAVVIAALVCIRSACLAMLLRPEPTIILLRLGRRPLFAIKLIGL